MESFAQHEHTQKQQLTVSALLVLLVAMEISLFFQPVRAAVNVRMCLCLCLSVYKCKVNTKSNSLVCHYLFLLFFQRKISSSIGKLNRCMYLLNIYNTI